jgi:3-oxoacyl-[acyl-carrier-protein] synthase-1
VTPPRPRLAVTAVGLATPLGGSALASVAALRAGVSRAAEVPGLRLPDRRRTRAFPAVAARVPFHTPARAPAALGAHLLTTAIADAERWWPGVEWDRALGPELQEHHEAVGGPGGSPDTPSADLVHTVGLDRLVGAAAEAREAPLGLAVADSLATAGALARLAEAGRLKSAATPSGLIPGDAGAALAVEPEDAARAAGRAVLALVEGWGRADEPVPLVGREPSRAVGLAGALADATAGLDAPPDLCVLDLNGERARALEWALASSRALPGPRTPSLWAPVDGVGDGGRATGLLLAVCATLALARGWSDRALVAASDDAGGRVALVLRAADRIGPRGDPARPPGPTG